MTDPEHHPRAVHGVHQLMSMAQQIRNKVAVVTNKASAQLRKDYNFDTGLGPPEQEDVKVQVLSTETPPDDIDSEAVVPDTPAKTANTETKTVVDKNNKNKEGVQPPPSLVEQQAKPTFRLEDLESDDLDDWTSKPVARGIAGRPKSETPAMEGAQRASIDQCDINVDSLAYWNDPVGSRDLNFVSPFVTKSESNGAQEKYITFASDRGGWNNVS